MYPAAWYVGGYLFRISLWGAETPVWALSWVDVWVCGMIIACVCLSRLPILR